MLVVVGSENPIKTAAVEVAFMRATESDTLQIKGVHTDSGVSHHPTSAEESLQGAYNRALSAAEQIPHADYTVGIEGGLLQLDSGEALELGWVVVRNIAGKTAVATSAGIQLEGTLLDRVRSGVELNEAVEEATGIHRIGDEQGFYGLATNGLVTRQSAYANAVTMALARFLHPELYT